MRPLRSRTVTERDPSATRRRPLRAHSSACAAAPGAVHRVAPGLDVDGGERSGPGRVGEDAVAVRPPGGGHRRAVAAEHPVRGRVPVAGHHLQRPPLEVGDRVAEPGAPCRVPDRPAAGERPLHGSRRVHGHEPPARSAYDMQPVRRPPGREEPSKPARAAIRPDGVGAAVRDREHGAARRKRREGRRGAGVVRGEAVADPVAHGGARRGQRDGEARGEQGGHEREPEGRPARRPPSGGRAALGQRRLHHWPGAGGGVGLARERLRPQAVADLVGRAHRSITSPSRSSARRSREFTVPRGMSRARAISPGV